MTTQTEVLGKETDQLAEDAEALMEATAKVAGDQINAARKRLAATLERAKDVATAVRDKAVAGAKATDEAVREHPYQAIAVGVGIGVLVGYLLGRRISNGRN